MRVKLILPALTEATSPLFRPINITTAPDGSLYIADMYRGVIEGAPWAKEGTYLWEKIKQGQTEEIPGVFAPLAERVVHQSVVDAENWVWGTPSLDGDTLYFSDVDGNFYSFNTSTGTQDWKPIKPNGPVTASPLVREEHILLATESGSIYAINCDSRTLFDRGLAWLGRGVGPAAGRRRQHRRTHRLHGRSQVHLRGQRRHTRRRPRGGQPGSRSPAAALSLAAPARRR